ncbi:MAG TPA: lysophospholipid acyltransferase family protein [Anaerolineae bacterium]|nr:lysophospholipid acyltransferase family protein [Anaerolineae bacterium]
MQRQVCIVPNPATQWLMTNRDPKAAEHIFYRLGRSVVDLYARATLKMDVHWHAPLPDGPKILAANHPTTTDPFLIMLLVSEQVSVLVTGGCFQIPLFGRLLLESGHVPVVRGTGGASVDAAVRLLEEGRTVAIFPEGAISPAEGGVHAPRSGVARLALRTGAPVIPVGIGLDRRRIRRIDSKVDGKPEVITWYVRGPYAVTVGRALSFAGDVDDWAHVRSVSDQVMHRIAGLARESDRRVAQAAAAACQANATPAQAL